MDSRRVSKISRATLASESETFRILKQRPFDQVLETIRTHNMNYGSLFGAKKILVRCGWTMKEYQTRLLALRLIQPVDSDSVL